MLRIVYFSEKRHIWDELKSHPEGKVFITPSPLKADDLRAKLPTDLSADVITIAKFTSNLIESLWEETERPVVKRKAELLLIFGLLKNKFLPDLGYEQFVQAYNLFSELRSFTLNFDALSSVFEEEAEDIRKALHIFWQLLESTGFTDEHGAYQRIAEALRSAEEADVLKKTYVFWGFQHLNGQQVDLIKALAIRYNVVIPFPAALKEKLRRTDWLSWIKEEKVQETNLPVIALSPKLHWLQINSREMALNLRRLIGEVSCEVILGVSKLTPAHIDYIPSDRVSFKVPHQMLGAEILEIYSSLDGAMGDGDTFESWLKSQRAMILKTLPLDHDFKRFRAFQLFEEAYLSLRELTDSEIRVDQFFSKLLRDVALLNQPRGSFVPLLKESGSINLRDMSSLGSIDQSKPVFLCVDEVFEDIQSLGLNYRDTIAKELSALGPLKRNELDLQFRQWELETLLSETSVTLLMPPGILKHNLVWKRIFQNVNLIPLPSPELSSTKSPKLHFATVPKKKFEGSFSASKLQTFVDCPQKFYFSYVEKITPDLRLERDIDARISGSLIHKVIEERKRAPVNVIAKELLDAHIREEGLILSQDTYEKRLLIITHRAQNGLSYLESVEALVPDVEWHIEKEFNDQKPGPLRGKIDCLGISRDFIFLLDFKSTASSASSNQEVESYESLQLWVYALAAQNLVPEIEKKNLALGFVVLDDPSSSSLLIQDEELMKQIKETKFTRAKLLPATATELLAGASEKIASVMLNIQNEETFPARPRKLAGCDLCDLRLVCDRGVFHV